jgi:hypothetical protein
MECCIRNNYDGRPYIHVTSLEALPVGDWDWHVYGPIRLGIHPTGLARFTPWEMAVAEVNRYLPDRFHLMECVLGCEQAIVAAMQVSRATTIPNAVVRCNGPYEYNMT